MSSMAPSLAALALLLAVPAPKPADPLARLDVRLRAGEWDALRAELEPAIAAAAGTRRAALLVALGLVENEASSYHRHDPQKAESTVMRAVEAARAEGDAGTRARARMLEGRVRYWQGFSDPPRWDEAQRILNDTRERAAEVKDGRLEAEAIFYLGLVAQQQGRWDAARPLFEDALARASRLRDDYLASYPERHLAYLAGEAKDLEQAEARHRRSVALREKVRATVFLPFARIALAGVLVERGRRPEAVTLLRRAAEEGARSGSRRAEARALLELQPLLAADGDAAGARETAARALTAARAFGDPELVAEAEQAKGE